MSGARHAPRLVATDLDGTLVRSDGSVSDRARAAITSLRARGVPVVGVTGRGPRLIELVRRDVGPVGPAILAQGGYVVDLSTGAELSVHVLPVALAVEVIGRLEHVVGDLIVAVEEREDITGPLRVQHEFGWPFPDPALLLERAQVLRGDALKVFLRSDRYNQDQLLALARDAVPAGLVELTHAGLGFIEVCPPGVTKATGLAFVAERFGIAADDVLCFGDMPNDLPMFAWCGYAVAVASAHPEVLMAADEITLGNDEDGVAVYLERLGALTPG